MIGEPAPYPQLCPIQSWDWIRLLRHVLYQFQPLLYYFPIRGLPSKHMTIYYDWNQQRSHVNYVALQRRNLLCGATQEEMYRYNHNHVAFEYDVLEHYRHELRLVLDIVCRVDCLWGWGGWRGRFVLIKNSERCTDHCLTTLSGEHC